jgi:hypothetical protein
MMIGYRIPVLLVKNHSKVVAAKMPKPFRITLSLYCAPTRRGFFSQPVRLEHCFAGGPRPL